MYPASAVTTMPGPLRRPRDTVSPDVSACSRMPSRRRPDSSEAAACPLSCAIVIAIRVIRHSRGLATISSATAALTAITHPGGASCTPVSRSQNTATDKGYVRRESNRRVPAAGSPGVLRGRGSR